MWLVYMYELKFLLCCLTGKMMVLCFYTFDCLIDWIEFYAVSAMFQPCNGGLLLYINNVSIYTKHSIDGCYRVNLSDHREKETVILLLYKTYDTIVSNFCYTDYKLSNMTVLKYNYICAIALLHWHKKLLVNSIEITYGALSYSKAWYSTVKIVIKIWLN